MERNENTSNAQRQGKKFVIVVNENRVEPLKQWYRKLPADFRRAVTERYGRLMDLWDVPVDNSAVAVLVEYWNSKLRCFEFPNIDLVPTLEEYACMMRMPITETSPIYFHTERQMTDAVISTKFNELLEAPPNQLKLAGPAGSRGLKLNVLQEYMQKLLHENRWAILARALALAIYGLILLPSVLNIIDQSAMDVFYEVEMRERNPIPAVLAETLLSISHCNKKGRAKVYCCTQLLYVWLVTHLFPDNGLNDIVNPLRSFEGVRMHPRSQDEWRAEFDRAGKEGFKWVCPWFRNSRGDVIFRCGDFSNVPLMGPRGCIAYSPALVLRQLGRTQGTPFEEQLGGYNFWYAEESEAGALSHHVRNAWGRVVRFGSEELGKFIVSETSGYTAWRVARRVRGGGPRLVQIKGMEPRKIAEMVDQLEKLKAQVEEVLEQKNDADEETSYQKRKYEALKINMNSLTRDHEEEIARARKGKAIMNPRGRDSVEKRMQKLTWENENLKKQWEERFLKEKQTRGKMQKESRRDKLAIDMLQNEIGIEKAIRRELENAYDILDGTLNAANFKCGQAYEEVARIQGMNDALEHQVTEKKSEALYWKDLHDKKKDEAELGWWVFQTVIRGLNEQAVLLRDHWEEAEKDRTNPFRVFPPGTTGLVDYCGSIVKGLNRASNEE